MALVQRKSTATDEAAPSRQALWLVLAVWLAASVLGMWFWNPVTLGTLSLCRTPPAVVR